MVQNNKSIAFLSRKFISVQQHTVTEKELLNMIGTINKFNRILLGQKIILYTDHMNMIKDTLDFHGDQVMRWQLMLE